MNDGQQNKHPQEEEIDLLELALKVWAERRWIYSYSYDCSGVVGWKKWGRIVFSCCHGRI